MAELTIVTEEHLKQFDQDPDSMLGLKFICIKDSNGHGKYGRHDLIPLEIINTKVKYIYRTTNYINYTKQNSIVDFYTSKKKDIITWIRYMESTGNDLYMCKCTFITL